MKGHNRGAEWLNNINNKLGNDKHLQERVVISVGKVMKQCRKIPNGKISGKDGVEGYWIKNLSNIHELIAAQMNKILMGDDSLPAWMTFGRTVLYQKDPRKGHAVEYYRPITCLPLMLKFLTGVIAEEKHGYLEEEKILPVEQKGSRRGSHVTKDQLLIDKTVLKGCKKRHINLSMAWIDYKKVDGFVLHSCINESMELFGITDNMKNFFEKKYGVMEVIADV